MATDNPLSAFFRGFQGAQKAAQAQQQQEVENELSRQLRAIQQAQLDKQLAEANKPFEQQMAEAFAKNVIEKGLYRQSTPVNPALAAQMSVLGETAGIPTGLQAPGLSEAIAERMKPAPMTVPGLPAGYEVDLNAPTEGLVRVAEARQRLAPPGFQVITDEFGNQRMVQLRGAGAGTGVATQITTPTGEDVKAPPKTKGAMTEFQKNGITSKAAFENIDYTAPEYVNETTGEIDYTKVNADASKARRVREDVEKKAKVESLTGKSKDDLSNLYAVQSQLVRFRDAIEDLDTTSKEPGKVQNALAVVGNSPSTGLMSSFKRQFARGFLSEDSKLKENLRGSVSSAVQSAISGKVITKLEAQQLGFIPQADDTIDDLVDKGVVLENWVNDKINGISKAQGITPIATTPTGGSKLDSLRSKYLK